MTFNAVKRTVSLLTLSCTILFTACETSSSSDELVGNWIRRAEFDGVGRTEAVTFTIGDKIYVGGGYDGTNRRQDFWVYNQTTNTWETIANFPGTARNSAVAFAANGKGYVGTGYDEYDNKLKDFWQYDPATNTWTQVADFGGSARYGAVAFSLNDKGYVTTGYDGNYLKDLWEYDAVNNSWTQKASLGGSKRSDAAVFVYNNQAYLVSGVNNGTYVNDFWVYNPSTNEWTEKRKINDYSDDSYDDDYDDYIRRSNASIFVMGDKAYLTCGYRSGIVATTWEYDISTDLWKEKTAFEGSPREGAIAYTLNNRGYIMLGTNSSNKYDDTWEFAPNDEQNDDDN
ncbi:MAG: kelch repeat-containing protein [Ferruginibacter sp.]